MQICAMWLHVPLTRDLNVLSPHFKNRSFKTNTTSSEPVKIRRIANTNYQPGIPRLLRIWFTGHDNVYLKYAVNKKC